MSSIMNRAAVVTMVSGAVTALAMPAAVAAPAPGTAHPALEVICDTLGPDTFVAASQPERAQQGAVVGWIDVTTRDGVTGQFRSHERVFEQQPNISVDEICSLDLAGERGAQTITFGFVLDGPVTLTGSDGRSAWAR